ncbi:S16 family serine protease [Actinomycetaceae bacterium MB13-C1-2]|nr:S16 family serine protease [Actinomycetaceae bacterium MB13-C1-2]
MTKHASRMRLVLRAAIVVALLTVLLIGVAMIPVPYVVHSPGPTVNVLGSQGSTVVLEFGEADDPSVPAVRPESEDEGQLRMVTVSESGGPGTKLRLIDLIRAKLNPADEVDRYEDLYDETITAEQLKDAGAAQMTSSHSAASIAAFDYLGIPMESTLTIEGAVPGSSAEGQVEQGDVLVSIRTPDGTEHRVDRPSVPFDLMKETTPGSTVVVTVDRGGEKIEIPIVTTGPQDGENFEGSKMGIYLSADTELPLDVTIHLERIGGPSAGLIFALGIINRLSDQDITGGQVIAGTGALSFSGDVMPIGGVKQKMYGAKRDGADWFLVPYDNCDLVVGNIPKGLTVIPVKTLGGAVDVVQQIAAGQTSGFATCEAAQS